MRWSNKFHKMLNPICAIFGQISFGFGQKCKLPAIIKISLEILFLVFWPIISFILGLVGYFVWLHSTYKSCFGRGCRRINCKI
jgi:hypothetical protein